MNKPELIAALKLAAEGRAEYALSSGPQEWKDYLKGQSAAYERAALLLENNDIYELITSQVPSWRWPKWVHDRVDGK